MSGTVVLSIIGMVIAVAMIIVLAYRGYQVVFLAPVAGVIIALSSGLGIAEGFSLFATGFGNVGKNVFFMYLACMVFGQCMVDNKSAHAIAYWVADHCNVKYAPALIFLITGILSIGGVNMGCLLIVGPIGTICLAKAGYSRNILLGAICAGMWSFALMGPMMPTGLNGVAQSILGTASTAGLIPGLAGMAFIIVADAVYLNWQAKRWKQKGIVFEDFDMLEEDSPEFRASLPNPLMGIIPIAVVLVAYNAFKLDVGKALFCGAIAATIVGWKRQSPKAWLKTWENGAKGSVTVIVNVAVMGGIGGVVGASPFFSSLVTWLGETTIHPYILCVLGGNLLACALGSATSAVSVALPQLLPMMENYVATRGCDMGNMHRLMVSGAIGMDSLPHNSAILAGNEMLHTTHKKSYWPIFVTCTLINILAAVCVVLPLAMLGFK